MMRLALPLIGLAVLSGPSVASEKVEEIQLSKALYFDCSVSSQDDAGITHKLAVSYLEYVDRPGRPQVNFFDPDQLVFRETGWAAQGSFILSRFTDSGDLFTWYGKVGSEGSPEVDMALALTRTTDQAGKGNVTMDHFETGPDGEVSVQRFAGVCEALSGASAYNMFSKGSAK
ncbi:MAG: hypothetical protein R3E14_13770 [Erythrobacter sp.]